MIGIISLPEPITAWIKINSLCESTYIIIPGGAWWNPAPLNPRCPSFKAACRTLAATDRGLARNPDAPNLEINNTVFLNQDDNTSSWYYLYKDIYPSYIQMYNYSLLPITILGLRCYILFHYYIFSLFDLDQHTTGIILLPSNQNLFLIFTIYPLILVTFPHHIN